MTTTPSSEFRKIPSVDQLLAHPAVSDVLGDEPRPLVVRSIRTHLESLRDELKSGARAQVPGLEDIARELVSRIRNRPRTLVRVLNATGVVLHTNLGRARLAPAAVEAVVEVASGACDLEFDLDEGKRSKRGAALEKRICEITGAEAALVVNNNAGAVVLALNELARGSEAIVSRGELVEIGGSFRLPELMESTGTVLKEVGTTNRTHLRDYQAAIGPNSGLLLKVHRSNFRVEGFTHEPSLSELVELSRSSGVPFLHDLGSGMLHGIDAAPEEPPLHESVRAGVDLVTFSGDKLLGGPQAGILVGRRDLLNRLRKSPLARALRIDKFTIAALAATLDLQEDAGEARAAVPVLRALSASPEEIARRASAMAKALQEASELEVSTVDSFGQVGGGAIPGRNLPGEAVALAHGDMSTQELARELRRLPLPIVGRIAEDRVLLDPRSLEPAEDAECVQAILDRFGGRGGGGR